MLPGHWSGRGASILNHSLHSSHYREVTQQRRRRQQERQKSNTGFDKQNNYFARVSRFFEHFSADVARLQRETA